MRRRQELLAARGKELAGAVGEHAETWRFERGLVVEAAADAPTWSTTERRYSRRRRSRRPGSRTIADCDHAYDVALDELALAPGDGKTR